MPSTSARTAAKVADHGIVEDRFTELDGYAVNFVTIKQTHDLAPMLAALPGGNCACPHWGYVFSGRVTVRYADHEETFEAGDAFYMPPGHAPAAEAGTELLQISPADKFAELEAAIAAAMQGGSGR
jgi:mannose-6-phosphate isomerase-like protein (cupin superfamily)